MALPSSVAEYRRTQAASTGQVVVAARGLWKRLGTGDWDSQWLSIAPQLKAVVTAGQIAAGTNAASYIDSEVAGLGLADGQRSQVKPKGLAGVASDGLPLEGLLYMPVLETRMFADPKTMSTATALQYGRQVLDRIVSTQISDAKRAAESVQMRTYPRVQYAYRVVYPPCCSRCAVLAGKRYRLADAGFLRHPQCDCGFQPAGDTSEPYDDVDELFSGGQIRGLSVADSKAISDGADANQVINAKRGMATANKDFVNVRKGTKFTTEGMTRRGIAGQLMRKRHQAASAYAAEEDQIRKTIRNAKQRAKRGSEVDWSQIQLIPQRHMPVRLRPESIYKFAPDRAAAIRLLSIYGYIT